MDKLIIPGMVVVREGRFTGERGHLIKDDTVNKLVVVSLDPEAEIIVPRHHVNQKEVVCGICMHTKTTNPWGSCDVCDKDVEPIAKSLMWQETGKDWINPCKEEIMLSPQVTAVPREKKYVIALDSNNVLSSTIQSRIVNRIRDKFEGINFIKTVDGFWHTTEAYSFSEALSYRNKFSEAEQTPLLFGIVEV